MKDPHSDNDNIEIFFLERLSIVLIVLCPDRYASFDIKIKTQNTIIFHSSYLTKGSHKAILFHQSYHF